MFVILVSGNSLLQPSYWLDPKSGVNYGHLFTDKSNQPVLNQLLLTAEKPLDTNATDWALGYRVQGMFGTDARYTHFLGELDTDIKERDQVDIVEAWAFIHAPLLTDGGVDYAFDFAGTIKAMETAYLVTRWGGTTVTASRALSHLSHSASVFTFTLWPVPSHGREDSTGYALVAAPTGTGRAGRINDMVGKEIAIVFGPIQQVAFLVVVRNQGDLLVQSHQDLLINHSRQYSRKH